MARKTLARLCCGGTSLCTLYGNNWKRLGGYIQISMRFLFEACPSETLREPDEAPTSRIPQVQTEGIKINTKRRKRGGWG